MGTKKDRMGGSCGKAVALLKLAPAHASNPPSFSIILSYATQTPDTFSRTLLFHFLFDSTRSSSVPFYRQSNSLEGKTLESLCSKLF